MWNIKRVYIKRFVDSRIFFSVRTCVFSRNAPPAHFLTTYRVVDNLKGAYFFNLVKWQ
jgi:hypothetical protein